MNGRRAKVAFIGTHGVGKTTLCYGLAARLKRRDVALDIVHEVARRCPLPINEATTATAQRWILLTQIAEELVACARYPVVLCDRSVLDNYVYLLVAAGPDREFEPLVAGWLPSYDLLVYVPILDTPSPDGVRADSASSSAARLPSDIFDVSIAEAGSCTDMLRSYRGTGPRR